MAAPRAAKPKAGAFGPRLCARFARPPPPRGPRPYPPTGRAPLSLPPHPNPGVSKASVGFYLPKPDTAKGKTFQRGIVAAPGLQKEEPSGAAARRGWGRRGGSLGVALRRCAGPGPRGGGGVFPGGLWPPGKTKAGAGPFGPRPWAPPLLCARFARPPPPRGPGPFFQPLAALIHQGSHPNGLHPPEGRLLGVVGHNDQGPTLAVGPNIFHGPQAGIRIQAFKSLVQRQQRGIV